MYRLALHKITAILFMCVLSNNTFALTCERTSKSVEGFKRAEYFDSWHPKEIYLNDREFTDTGKGSKAMVFTKELWSTSGDLNVMTYRLLPNGKLIAKLKDKANYMSTGHVRYKCDKNSNEVRQLLASGSAANNNSKNSSSSVEKGCFDGNVSVCTSEQLCNRATSRRTGVQQWDSLKQFQPYVAEAKSRGLTCGVGDSSTSPSQNQSAIELPETIPSYYDDFRKVTFQFSSGELKTFGAGKVTSTADGFRTDGRVIIRKSLCTANSEFTNNTQEGSFEINCPDGLNIKGGYVPLGTNKGSIGRGYDNKGNAVEYRLHSNTGSNYVSKADFVRFYEAAFSTSKLDKAKSTCTELGFTLGTEKHGDCVLKMMDN